MESVLQKFLRYAKYDTQSQEDVEQYPSTSKQLVLLKKLSEELKEIGMQDVSMDQYGYVFATLPSNTEKDIPSVGFISHVDTSYEVSGTNVNPQLHENYNGEDIVLNNELGLVLSADEFPELKNYKGETIVTTDGTTLLGADDKAGVAEIVAAMEYLMNHLEIKHGVIRVGFTPDEEVGRGVDFFDVKKFNADLAYTVDGGKLGELEYECFNAASARVTINGKSVHPGSAKGIMINSILIAKEFMAMLPENETPAATEGYEGFYHITDISGGVEKTTLKYILRDFTLDGLKNRKETILRTAKDINKKYGGSTVTVELKDQYYNMVEKVKEHIEIVDTAKKAMEDLGIVPKINPIRGGTDGARLSFMGLPCPNIFTGGHNFHGKYEYIPVSSMEKCVQVILKIIELYTK
jgi:peptidase T